MGKAALLPKNMEIKKQYEINDDVWIHLGNGSLHKGTVVEYFDLGHIGRDRATEYYVIEVPSSIEPLLEVRTWKEISQDSKGPIAAYRELKEDYASFKKLGKVGIEIKAEGFSINQIDEIYDENDPSPEEVNAALERAVKARQEIFNPSQNKPSKKKYYRKKNERRAGPETV